MHNLEKTNDYTLLLKQVEALIQDEPDYIANMANVASFIGSLTLQRIIK